VVFGDMITIETSFISRGDILKALVEQLGQW
jgi:hypothetical protein